MLPMFAVQANIVVGGTRLIFDGNKKETSISVENKEDKANLVQSWLTPVDKDSPSKEAFIITPPLFRLDAGQKNVLRIVRSGLTIPENKESMYWLNIKGIPSTEEDDKNVLQIAINTRIKLIYRPATLTKIVPEDVADKIQWYREDDKLQIKNSSPYYMNFSEIRIGAHVLDKIVFVPPFSSESVQLPKGIKDNVVSWKIINDYGRVGESHTTSL